MALLKGVENTHSRVVSLPIGIPRWTADLANERSGHGQVRRKARTGSSLEGGRVETTQLLFLFMPSPDTLEKELIRASAGEMAGSELVAIARSSAKAKG